MSDVGNNYESAGPMLLPEEEKKYETQHGSKFQLGSSKNRVIATNRRLLILSGKGYKSLFYDKITAINVKRGGSSNKLEICLLGAKEPEVVSLSKKGAIDLFDIISNLTSLSSDSRLAYAIGSIEAQNRIKEKEQAMAYEMGARQVMQYSSVREAHDNGGPGSDYLESYSKTHAISVEAKNSDGKKLDVNFNFVPKVKNIVSSRLTSEALYTLANGMYSGSAIVASLFYGTAKNAKATLSATMASTLKQSIKEDYLRNVQGLRCVALSNIQHMVELEDPMAYADLRHFTDVAVDEFTSDVYHDFGAKLAGLDHHEELINKTHMHEAGDKVVEQVHAVESEHVVNIKPMAGMLRRAHHEQTLLGSPETGVITHVGQQGGNSSTGVKQKWKPEEELLIFRLREHKNKNSRNFADLIKQNPSD